MVNAKASKVVDHDETSQESPPKPKKRRLKLRSRKTKEHVMDKINMYLNHSSSEEDDVTRKFNLNEKLTCERYSPENNQSIIIHKQASEITLEYFQKYDFETPILIKENTNNGLGLKMPDSNFWVDDVKDLVGPRRLLDVMNVETQEAETMKMKDWATYFKKSDRDRLLNVISLEFSHTKLDALVDSPKFVKKMDWVDLVWPRHLKKQQKEGTNTLQEMKYPKVQKYCLMSVGNCYTDFHIDFGGTSVWYHILRGGKVFWLIPPSEKNLKLYEEWTLSGKQAHIFFGDTVEECVRVNLKTGNTFLIPTGWIHAVYTTEDSLVFGGNFLHSFGIEKQLKCAEVEVSTKVGQKFRYPFFNQLMWYVVIRYVHCLTGKNYLCVDDDGKSLLPEDKENENNLKKENDVKIECDDKVEIKNSYDTETENEEEEKIVEMQRKFEEAEIKRKMKLKFDRSKFPSKPYISFTPSHHVHLCHKEIQGLNVLINWLDKLPPAKKSIPELLISPESLLQDARQLLEDHKYDNQEFAINGDTPLFWITKDFIKSHKPKRSYVKRAKQAQVEINENNGDIVPVSFSNLSASVMSQDSNNHKLSAGTTLKKELIPKGLQSLIAATDVNNMASTSSVASPLSSVQIQSMSLVRPIPLAAPAPTATHSPYSIRYGSQTHNPQVNSSNQFTNGHVLAVSNMAYSSVPHHIAPPAQPQAVVQQSQVHPNYVHPTAMIVQQPIPAAVVAQAAPTSMTLVQVPPSPAVAQHVQVPQIFSPTVVGTPVLGHPVQRTYYANYSHPHSTTYAQPNGHANYYNSSVPPTSSQTRPPSQVAQYSYPVQSAPVHTYAPYQAQTQQPPTPQYQPAPSYLYQHQQASYSQHPHSHQQYSVNNDQVPITSQSTSLQQQQTLQVPPQQLPHQQQTLQVPPQPPLHQQQTLQLPQQSPHQQVPSTQGQAHHIQASHQVIHQQHPTTNQLSTSQAQMYQYPTYNYHY